MPGRLVSSTRTRRLPRSEANQSPRIAFSPQLYWRLFQSTALRNYFLQRLVESTPEDQDLHFQYYMLAGRQRGLRVNVLACEFRIAPHIAGCARKASDDPLAIRRKRCDHWFVDSSRLVVIRDAVPAMLHSLRGHRPCE